jgi:hypothetical protein
MRNLAWQGLQNSSSSNYRPMHNEMKSKVFPLFFLILIAFVSNPALAVLGGAHDESGLSLKAPAQKNQHGQFTEFVMDTPQAQVKELSDTTGRVFAVCWRGRKPPNLPALLGQRYGEYQAQSLATPKKQGRGTTVITTSDMTVVLQGNMRALHGAAYLTNGMPQGLTAGSVCQ